MYIRDAKNRDEAWLLDAIEQLGLDDVAFRSRDYVIAVDEESGDRAGFGRLRLHHRATRKKRIGSNSPESASSPSGGTAVSGRT